jgi:SnoaL-like domain
MSQTDREQIQNHLAKYCFVVDRGSAEEIAALFWDDARLEFNGTHLGNESIRQCFAEWIRKLRDPVEGLRHLIYVPLITMDGDSATAETYVDADGHVRKSGRTILLRSLYRDRLTRRNGEWRFAERQIVAMRSLYDVKREPH